MQNIENNEDMFSRNYIPTDVCLHYIVLPVYGSVVVELFKHVFLHLNGSFRILYLHIWLALRDVHMRKEPDVTRKEMKRDPDRVKDLTWR